MLIVQPTKKQGYGTRKKESKKEKRKKKKKGKKKPADDGVETRKNNYNLPQISYYYLQLSTVTSTHHASGICLAFPGWVIITSFSALDHGCSLIYRQLQRLPRQ